MDDLSRNPLLSTAIVVAVAAVLWVLAVRTGRRWIRMQEGKDPESGARAKTLWVMIRRVTFVTLLTLVVLAIFSIWGLSMAPFVAVGAILAAAVGFGAQDLVRDVIAGFFILAENQFQIGDTIAIAGVTGEVTDIQFRVTVLRDFEGKVHYVPNGQITVTTNYTHQFAQPVLDIGVAYREDVDRAIRVMLDELRAMAEDAEWHQKIKTAPEIMGVQELADSAVVIRARLTTAAGERWNVRRESLRRIKNRFDQEGIEIPFPHVTVYQRD